MKKQTKQDLRHVILLLLALIVLTVVSFKCFADRIITCPTVAEINRAYTKLTPDYQFEGVESRLISFDKAVIIKVANMYQNLTCFYTYIGGGGKSFRLTDNQGYEPDVLIVRHMPDGITGMSKWPVNYNVRAECITNDPNECPVYAKISKKVYYN